MDGRVNGPRPRLSLSLKRLRGSRVRARVAGGDRRFVRRADFKVGNRRVGADRRTPFMRTIRIASTRRQTIRVIVVLDDGTRAILKRVLRPRGR
jgi:hypothetical protein